MSLCELRLCRFVRYVPRISAAEILGPWPRGFFSGPLLRTVLSLLTGISWVYIHINVYLYLVLPCSTIRRWFADLCQKDWVMACVHPPFQWPFIDFWLHGICCMQALWKAMTYTMMDGQGRHASEKTDADVVQADNNLRFQLPFFHRFSLKATE